MTFEEALKAPLVELLPPELRVELCGALADEAGFAAGPAFVAGKTRAFTPPVPFAEAAGWIERTYRGFKRAHVRLVDGRTVYFHPSGLRSVAPPRPPTR